MRRGGLTVDKGGATVTDTGLTVTTGVVTVRVMKKVAFVARMSTT